MLLRNIFHGSGWQEGDPVWVESDPQYHADAIEKEIPQRKDMEPAVRKLRATSLLGLHGVEEGQVVA